MPLNKDVICKPFNANVEPVEISENFWFFRRFQGV